MNKTFLIAGADHGLGLEFAKQLTELGHTVFVTSSKTARVPEIKQLCKKHRKRMCALRLDASDDHSVEKLADDLHFVTIDVLINNTEFAFEDCSGLEKLDTRELLKVFNAGCLGPFRVVKALLPVLRASDKPVVVNIGSVKTTRAGACLETGSALLSTFSKAALNLASKTLALSLQSERIISVTVAPSLPRPIGEGNGDGESVDRSVREMIEMILSLTRRDTGRVLDPRGRDFVSQ